MGTSSYIAGVVFAVSWLVLIDGILYTDTNPSDTTKLDFKYALPGLFCSLGFAMLNLISYADVVSDSMFKEVNTTALKTWLFCSIVISLGAVVSSVWIATETWLLTAHGSRWPGVAMILQTCMIFVCGLIWWIVRTRPQGSSALF